MLDLIRNLSGPRKARPVSSTTDISQQAGHMHEIRGILFDVYGTLLISGAGVISEDKKSLSKQETMREALLIARMQSSQVMPMTAAGPSKAKSLQKSAKMLTAEASSLVRRLDAMVESDRAVATTRGISYPEVDLKAIWHRLLPDTCSSTVIRIALSYECLSNPTWPMPNAADTIAKLQSWCPVGLVSNAQFYTPLVLEALLPEVVFDPQLVVWSFTEMVAKPSRKIFQRAMDNMRHYHGIPPSQILMVGNDLLNDIWGAHQMGLQGALFAGDENSLYLRPDDPRCTTLKPELVLTDLSQLPTAIVKNVNENH